MFALTPMAVAAADIEAGTPTPSVVPGNASSGYTNAQSDPANAALPHPAGSTLAQSTIIGYGGHEWVVIGWDGNGVASSADTATLLLSNTDGNKPNTFLYSNQGANTYNGSELQDKISGFYNSDTIGFPSKEKSFVLPRSLEGGSGVFSSQNTANNIGLESLSTVAGSIDNASQYTGSYYCVDDTSTFDWYAYDAYRKGLTGTYAYSGTYHPDRVAGTAPSSAQALWPLSNAEVSVLDPSIREYTGLWWLRSPGSSNTTSVGTSGTVYVDGPHRINPCSIRPAFNLNLSSVIFTSAASGGKPATVGSNLSAVQTPSGKLKFTFEDAALSLSANQASRTAKSGDTVSIPYTGAVTGAGKYVSAVIVDGTDTKFYGKLVDLTSGSSASGTVTFTVPAVANLPDGNYTLRLFYEEIGGENYSDFASTPVDIPLTVKNSITVDKTALQNALELADTINWGGVNTTTAWTNFTNEKTIALAVFNNPSVTQLEVDNATAALNATILALKHADNSKYFEKNIRKHTIGSTNNLVHIIAHDWALQTGVVKVDGNTLTLDKDYTSAEGSTKTTLLASYLDTLTPGTHTLTVEFSSGTANISDTFEIGNNNGSPKTSDDMNLTLLIMLCGGALLALTLLMILRRKTKAQD
jgi:hypothetical protein